MLPDPIRSLPILLFSIKSTVLVLYQGRIRTCPFFRSLLYHFVISSCYPPSMLHGKFYPLRRPKNSSSNTIRWFSPPPHPALRTILWFQTPRAAKLPMRRLQDQVIRPVRFATPAKTGFPVTYCKYSVAAISVRNTSRETSERHFSFDRWQPGLKADEFPPLAIFTRCLLDLRAGQMAATSCPQPVTCGCRRNCGIVNDLKDVAITGVQSICVGPNLGRSQFQHEKCL